MKRREFLHPRRLANIVAPVVGVTDELAPHEECSSQDAAMLRFARRAMATTFEVILPFDVPSSDEIAQTALDEIDRLEAQLTVYRDTSEVGRLNARAAQHPVRVEANLFELLALAEQMHRETNGAFDISVGALIKTWGFYRRQGRVPSPEERAHVRERIGMQHVVLDQQKQTVHYRRQGLEINLGSIGKGYALDQGATLVRRRFDAPNLLLHGGHSSILARGNETQTSNGWTVGLTDPENPVRRRALVHLKDRGLATSAITHQHFMHEGKKLGHLLDPRSAWPAEDMLHATVTAPSAALADALASAFFVLGVDQVRAYCDEHPNIGAILISAATPERLTILGRAADEVEVLR
jgi:FAD:protein FMN transferase